MSSRTNFNDSVDDVFQFTIGGLDYDFVFPTMDEVEPITDLTKERQKLEKEETPESVDKIEELDKKLEKTIYGFIRPVGHETPIEETLKKQSVKVNRKFNKTIIEQLTAE